MRRVQFETRHEASRVDAPNLGSAATHVRDTDNLSKALADGVRDGLVDNHDVGLDLLEKST